MPITLTITDQADGTGVTATIAGSDGGSTNSVYVQPSPSGVFTLRGTRTGDGTIAISLGDGAYWAYVQGVVAGVPVLSNLVLFNSTSGYDASHWLAMLHVKQEVIGINLEDIGGKVHIHTLPNEKIVEFPCVIICPIDLSRLENVSTCSYSAKKPISIFLCDRNDPDDVTPLPKWLQWREWVEDHFFTRRNWSAIPGLQQYEIPDSQMIDQEVLKQYHFIRQTVVLMADLRKLRD